MPNVTIPRITNLKELVGSSQNSEIQYCYNNSYVHPVLLRDYRYYIILYNANIELMLGTKTNI